MPGARWSAEHLATLDAMYATTDTAELAARLGRRVSPVQKMAQLRGLRKAPEFLKELRRANIPPASIATRFKPVHGRSTPLNGKRDPTYTVWRTMHQRCNYTGHKSYAGYGGRGIQVCRRWDSFSAFLEDVGPRPQGRTLGRIDNNGNYEPGNVRWETAKQQAQNRRSTVWITAFGETKSLSEWAEAQGIRSDTLAYRINKGWPVEKALTQPIGQKESR